MSDVQPAVSVVTVTFPGAPGQFPGDLAFPPTIMPAAVYPAADLPDAAADGTPAVIAETNAVLMFTHGGWADTGVIYVPPPVEDGGS